MVAADTVHINISIQIRTEDVVDTGVTGAGWNAMTDGLRSEAATALWEEMAANSDHGGMTVVTDGAEGI